MIVRFSRPPRLRGRSAGAGGWLARGLLTLGSFAAVPAAGQPAVSESIYRQSADAAAEAPVPDAKPAVGDSELAGRAERIVAASLAGLERAASISARARQRVRVGDRVLVGAGRYIQSGVGEDQRFRFESAMKSDTEEFELLEVSDGVFFWTYRRLGTQPPQVERIDIRRVREQLEKLRPAPPVSAVAAQPGSAGFLQGASTGGAMSAFFGGIQRSLALTREWFQFVSVESSSIDDVATWSIEGRWDPWRLGLILPAQAEEIRKPGGIAPAALPDGMPWSVRLSIGKRELFPFRIEWLAIPGRRPVADGKPEPVAVLELYDVRMGEPVDAAAFVYKPATEGLVDLTETAVKLVAPLRP